MKHDMIVNGEAMSALHRKVARLTSTPRVIEVQQEPQRSAFNAYRVAFRANSERPCLANAAALVSAWNAFADVMGLERV